MITRIYAHSAAERRHGSPNQAIDCNRTLAVQQYLFLRRHHGLRPRMARDRLYQIMFIGVTGGRYVPSTTAVHRPVEAVIGARRIEDNASTGATGEVGGWQFDGPEILDEVDEIEPRAIGLEVAAAADAWLAARAERDTGRVESPSSKAGPVPSVGPVDEDDSLFARAFRAEMARS